MCVMEGAFSGAKVELHKLSWLLKWPFSSSTKDCKTAGICPNLGLRQQGLKSPNMGVSLSNEGPYKKDCKTRRFGWASAALAGLPGGKVCLNIGVFYVFPKNGPDKMGSSFKDCVHLLGATFQQKTQAFSVFCAFPKGGFWTSRPVLENRPRSSEKPFCKCKKDWKS